MSDIRSTTSLHIKSSVLIFLILMLAVGALLLATSGIDPQANVRAVVSATPEPPTVTPTSAPTVPPFASLGYKQYQSADNVLRVDYPDQWTPVVQSNAIGPVYVLSPGGATNTSGILILVQVYDKATILKALPGLTPLSSTRSIVTTMLSQQGQAPTNLIDVQASGLSGVSFHNANATDQTKKPTNTEQEVWFLSVDAGRIAVVQANAPTGQWTGKMAEIFQHVVNSLVITPIAATAVVPSAATAAASAAATRSLP